MDLLGKIWIVGPCSAESVEQVLATSQALPPGIIFRAGVWKPRTNPNTFQGAGMRALPWLQATRRPTATEVATSEHIHAAVQAGIQYLWIGARTAANPIAVQMLADTLATLPQRPTVLVKNPVNEDAALWLGNIHRLERAGVPVMAIHRGCNHKPCWRMAFELRRQRPDIPLLLDPSHMSGDAKRITELCKKALELEYNGFMIEVHPDPKNALSDSLQQITPKQLTLIIHHLQDHPVPTNDPIELRWRRAEIDELDDQLWSTILRRMQVSDAIGKLKKSQHLPTLQPKRWQQLVDYRRAWAKENGLPTELIDQILEAIHKVSLDRQQ